MFLVGITSLLRAGALRILATPTKALGSLWVAGGMYVDISELSKLQATQIQASPDIRHSRSCRSTRPCDAQALAQGRRPCKKPEPTSGVAKIRRASARRRLAMSRQQYCSESANQAHHARKHSPAVWRRQTPLLSGAPRPIESARRSVLARHQPCLKLGRWLAKTG
jgi:hypothetical protein